MTINTEKTIKINAELHARLFVKKAEGRFKNIAELIKFLLDEKEKGVFT